MSPAVELVDELTNIEEDLETVAMALVGNENDDLRHIIGTLRRVTERIEATRTKVEKDLAAAREAVTS